MLHEVTSVNDFETLTKEYPQCLVEFFQPWCPYCKAFFPTLKAYSEEAGTLPVIQVSGESFPQIFEAYGIQSYPTLMVFKNGQPVFKEEGGLEMPALKEFVAEGLAQ